MGVPAVELRWIQSAGLGPYAKYGGFTNFANATVLQVQHRLSPFRGEARGRRDPLRLRLTSDGPRYSMLFPGRRCAGRGDCRFPPREPRRARTGPACSSGLPSSAWRLRGRGGRAGHSWDGAGGRLHRADALSVALGAGQYHVPDPNGQPYDIVSSRSTAGLREAGSRNGSTGRQLAPGPPLRAATTPRARCAHRSPLRVLRASTSSSCGIPPSSTRPRPSTRRRRRPRWARRPAAPKGRAAPGATARRAKPCSRREPVRRPTRGADVAPGPACRRTSSGRFPVLMHHMIRSDRVGEYDQTPEEFRAELEYLWRQANAGERRRTPRRQLDVPKGATPVAFTFDDATTYQLDFNRGGRVAPGRRSGSCPSSAEHPGFVPKGTFYVNRLHSVTTPWRTRAAVADRERLRDREPHARPRSTPHPRDEDVRKQLATVRI